MKEKKTLILLIMIAVVGIVGLTIAYFTNTTSISNLFSTNPYGTTVTEVFESPDNWLPGTTTPKTIEVTNSGSVDEAVRISYTEKWKSKKGNTLSGLIDSNGNLTDEEENSEHAAIINFSDNGDFTYSNGYYYYNYKLAPNEKTSTLIDSVTFNSKVKNDSNCTTVENNGVKTITCNSTQDGYDGATYTLTFTIETVQYDKYMSAWGTDVAIALQENKCSAYKKGDEVTFDGAKYYVLYDSDVEDNYITLLKADVLTYQDLKKYSTDDEIRDFGYLYGNSKYDKSEVKRFVDEWSEQYKKVLVKIDNYKARLLNKDDLINSLGYEISGDDSNLTGNATSATPDWAYISGKEYWMMSNVDMGYSAYVVSENISKDYSYGPEYYIRPVINIKKEAINDACIATVCNTYKKGDEITYDGAKYYVLEDSVKYEYYITLLKADFLTAEEVNEYSTDYTSIDGEYPYLIKNNCTSSNSSNCSTNYDISSIKTLIDNWASKYSKDLDKVDGYKVRLLTKDDLIDLLGYEIDTIETSEVIIATENTPDWVYISGKKYWSMSSLGESKSDVYGISNTLSMENVSNKIYIRPVIYLKKSSIESECIVNGAVDYYIGDTLSYNNENYCVINDSKTNDDYVTLIKQEPLTYDELVANKGNLSTDYFENNNGIGLSNYYKSETCYRNSANDYDYSGCNNNYNTSFIKTIINNWSNSFNNDLKEVDGYKVRLLNVDELFEKLGYDKEMRVTDSTYSKTDNVPMCLYNSNYTHWTMSGAEDKNGSVYVIKSDGSLTNGSIRLKNAVRPVINLKKCAITNTCE